MTSSLEGSAVHDNKARAPNFLRIEFDMIHSMFVGKGWVCNDSEAILFSQDFESLEKDYL
jgi:hypothetical protein